MFDNLNRNQGEIPWLCRNCKARYGLKSPEQELRHTEFDNPCSERSEGIFYMSAEQFRNYELTETLAQDRLLSEVDLLLTASQAAVFEPSIIRDLKINKHTAVEESAMPYAVSRTFQPAVETIDEQGRQKRMFMWLGKMCR